MSGRPWVCRGPLSRCCAASAHGCAACDGRRLWLDDADDLLSLLRALLRCAVARRPGLAQEAPREHFGQADFGRCLGVTRRLLALRPADLKLAGDHPIGRECEARVDSKPVAIHAVDEHEQRERHRQRHGPRDLEPREEERGDMEGDEAGSKEEKGEAVLEHETIDSTVHRAVWAAESKPGAQHRAQRRVEHCDQLKAHRRGGHAQVERLQPIGRLGGDVDLDDAVVGETGEERGL